jgi:hypothetical protein
MLRNAAEPWENPNGRSFLSDALLTTRSDQRKHHNAGPSCTQKDEDRAKITPNIAQGRGIQTFRILARGKFRARTAKAIVHLKRHDVFRCTVAIVHINPFIFEKLVSPGWVQRVFIKDEKVM